MNDRLKCFLSASYETETELLKNLLSEHDVEVFDLYDFSIGESIQQILKRKLRQSDFALFILSEDNKNVLYEMGVCEGLGKQHFILLEKDFKVPFYIENRLFINVDLKDRELLKLTVDKVLLDVKRGNVKTAKRKKGSTQKEKLYNRDILDNLRSYINQISGLRASGHGRELEYIIEEIFKTLKLNYVDNTTGQDKGVDFAIWNNELSRIIGNPIIVEVKYGGLSKSTFQKAEEQLRKYIDQTEAKVGLLLYLDRNNKRYEIQSTLSPLLISYDVSDFVNDLVDSSFERIILNHRNKIAHGIK